MDRPKEGRANGLSVNEGGPEIRVLGLIVVGTRNPRRNKRQMRWKRKTGVRPQTDKLVAILAGGVNQCHGSPERENIQLLEQPTGGASGSNSRIKPSRRWTTLGKTSNSKKRGL